MISFQWRRCYNRTSFLPLHSPATLVPSCGTPRSFQSPAPSPAHAAEPRLGVQQIVHRSKKPKEPLSYHCTTAQPLRGAIHYSCTEVRDGIVGLEAAFEASVTEITIPCIMHPVTEVLMLHDAQIASRERLMPQPLDDGW